MKAALRVLTYLNKTRNSRLVLGDLTGRALCNGEVKAPEGLVAFTDSSWGDEKPASGYACYYKGSLIAWAAKRLKSTPLSSCESEYMAASNAAAQVMFLRDLVDDLGMCKGEMTVIYCDNSAACQLSEDALSGKRVKHAMRKLTYLRELREENKAGLKYVPGEHNVADVFTKPLAGERHAKLTVQLIDLKVEKVPAHDATVLGWVTHVDRNGRKRYEALVDPDLLHGP